MDSSLETDQGSNGWTAVWKQIREVMVDNSLETDQGSNDWTAVWKQIREVMVGQQSGNRIREVMVWDRQQSGNRSGK